MKTAISVPDELFDAAERAAERLGLSRSELYRRALAVYLEQREEPWITEALDRVYADATEAERLHPGLRRIQSLSIPTDDW